MRISVILQTMPVPCLLFIEFSVCSYIRSCTPCVASHLRQGPFHPQFSPVETTTDPTVLPCGIDKAFKAPQHTSTSLSNEWARFSSLVTYTHCTSSSLECLSYHSRWLAMSKGAHHAFFTHCRNYITLQRDIFETQTRNIFKGRWRVGSDK